MTTVPVHLPSPLRPLADGRVEVEVAAGTVGEALAALAEIYPGLHRHLFAEDGQLRSFVNAFVNEHDARALAGPATPLVSGDRLTILPSIAGG